MHACRYQLNSEGEVKLSSLMLSYVSRFAATGSPEKAEIALAAGAAAAVSYGDDPRAFREHVKELAPGGVDVAVDMVWLRCGI